jgi:hypothetical protein
MLYLVYEYGWTASDFTGEIFKRVFERQEADAQTCLNAAREAFDQNTVRWWMQNQISEGN